MDNMREKTDRSIRLLKMFDMLQRGAGLNSRELQDRFGITAKSVQRDIEELRTYIADNYDQAEGENIEYSRIQKSYFWRNRSNIMLDEKEILLIAVILLESRGLTKDELQRLLEKILLQCSKTSEKKIRQLIQKEMFYYKATQNAKPILDLLLKIIDAKQRKKSQQESNRIQYQISGGDISTGNSIHEHGNLNGCKIQIYRHILGSSFG